MTLYLHFLIKGASKLKANLQAKFDYVLNLLLNILHRKEFLGNGVLLHILYESLVTPK